MLVHNNRIIGEGYHRAYGQPHAEVNAVAAVNNPELLRSATLYVNLEPCNHHGKTPPCTDLILQHGIPRVVVGTIDTFGEVAGKGIQRLREHGVEVITGVLEKECRELNRRFFYLPRAATSIYPAEMGPEPGWIYCSAGRRSGLCRQKTYYRVTGATPGT